MVDKFWVFCELVYAQHASHYHIARIIIHIQPHRLDSWSSLLVSKLISFTQHLDSYEKRVPIRIADDIRYTTLLETEGACAPPPRRESGDKATLP